MNLKSCKNEKMINPFYISRPPKSKLIIGNVPIIALILNMRAPKLIIGDPFNKGGPTLNVTYLRYRLVQCPTLSPHTLKYDFNSRPQQTAQSDRNRFRRALNL